MEKSTKIRETPLFEHECSYIPKVVKQDLKWFDRMDC